MNIGRGGFLKSLGAVSALAAGRELCAGGLPASGGRSDGALKVCVFADLHYHPGVFPNDAHAFLDKIMDRAARAGCDMMIHLGDFVHNVTGAEQKAFIAKYNDSKIPAYHILGNHDQDGSSWKAAIDAYRMPDGHYFFDRGGFRFVVADPNYTVEPGQTPVHHEHGNYFKRSRQSKINWIPKDQVEWMRDAILNSPHPCVVLSHQSFERPPNGAGVWNKDEIQAIFREANARTPGRVWLVMNGHMHIDHLRVLDNVLYWDVNSANYQWFNKTHEKYPADYVKAHRLARHCLAWTEPLSAILTLWPDGRIRIDGSRADWLYGVTPRAAGLDEYDPNGRYTLPVIQSADMTFRYS